MTNLREEGGRNMGTESAQGGLRRSFHHQIDEVELDIHEMGRLVGERLDQAVAALCDKDLESAREVEKGDIAINNMELRIEERCMQLLALQQPLATDLRHISTMLKIITDLERMGDHAKDVARTALRIGKEPLMKPLVDIPRMAAIAHEMLDDALKAYSERDIERAVAMVKKDHELDHLYNQIFRELLTYMIEDPRHIRQAAHLLFIAAFLERFGDHATNVGEWVVFMVTGERRELNE